MVGDDGADRVALAVVRLLAQQDQVGRLGLEHLRERVAGRVDVGALEGGVGQVDRAVGAERDGLVERADGALGAHRHRDDLLDLGLAAFADLHRGLDAVGVEGVQVLLAGAIQTLGARVDPLLDRRVRNLLDKTTDLQVGASLGKMARYPSEIGRGAPGILPRCGTR